jgi:Na(+)-translocating NADH:ubiquinone oxidoreductase F subunit
MFPMVPYHALPRLHELIKDECPSPNPSLWFTIKEIWQALQKQKIDPEYVIERVLPAAKGVNSVKNIFKAEIDERVGSAWYLICSEIQLRKGDVSRFDLNEHTFAIYKTGKNNIYATDGMCTHGNAHLATGLIVGEEIECAKHNGRFHLKSGKPARMPVCLDIVVYPTKVENGKVYVDLSKLKNKADNVLKYTVVSNNNVATYIKELELAPINDAALNYKPGEYVQLTIPAGTYSITPEVIDEKYRAEYETLGVYGKSVTTTSVSNRNYSFATNPSIDKTLKFNVRLALPPKGSDYPIGSGSAYVTNLKVGDKLSLKAPFGDFHIKETTAEMVYIGGGAGMAPLRSHISYLLETLKSKRKISFWYGARNENEVFYKQYFEDLAKAHPNFTFNIALSNSENTTGLKGFIHDVVNDNYISKHTSPKKNEYYLCGPPVMISAVKNMLNKYEVPDEQIAFDEF